MIGVTNRDKVMQPAQGWMRDWCAATMATTNQKPGTESRPGSILQFQFTE
jgi:hypothetical protein